MGSLRARRWFAVASLLFSSVLTSSLASPPDEDLPGNAGDAARLALAASPAEAGNPTAQTQIGNFYVAALDFTNAVIWYRKAADRGDLEAQLALASCYLAGRGTARDLNEAARLLRAAAAQLEGPQQCSETGPSPGRLTAPPRPSPTAQGASGLGSAAAATHNAATPRVQRVLEVQAPLPLLLESAPQLRLVRAAP